MPINLNPFAVPQHGAGGNDGAQINVFGQAPAFFNNDGGLNMPDVAGAAIGVAAGAYLYHRFVNPMVRQAAFAAGQRLIGIVRGFDPGLAALQQQALDQEIALHAPPVQPAAVQPAAPQAAQAQQAAPVQQAAVQPAAAQALPIGQVPPAPNATLGAIAKWVSNINLT